MSTVTRELPRVPARGEACFAAPLAAAGSHTRSLQNEPPAGVQSKDGAVKAEDAPPRIGGEVAGCTSPQLRFLRPTPERSSLTPLKAGGVGGDAACCFCVFPCSTSSDWWVEDGCAGCAEGIETNGRGDDARCPCVNPSPPPTFSGCEGEDACAECEEGTERGGGGDGARRSCAWSAAGSQGEDGCVEGTAGLSKDGGRGDQRCPGAWSVAGSEGEDGCVEGKADFSKDSEGDGALCSSSCIPLGSERGDGHVESVEVTELGGESSWYVSSSYAGRASTAWLTWLSFSSIPSCPSSSSSSSTYAMGPTARRAVGTSEANLAAVLRVESVGGIEYGDERIWPFSSEDTKAEAGACVTGPFSTSPCSPSSPPTLSVGLTVRQTLGRSKASLAAVLRSRSKSWLEASTSTRILYSCDRRSYSRASMMVGGCS
jgi:hypothetical protein